MTHEEYLKFIEKKLDDGIAEAEGMIVGAMWKEPDLYSEITLNKKILSNDALIFYDIGFDLYHMGNNVFTEASVLLLLEHQDGLREEWEKRGGWSSIKGLMRISSPENIDSYLNQFSKYQYAKRLHNKGFVVDVENVSKMSLEQLRAWYEYQILDDDFNAISDIEFEPLYMTDNEIEDLKNGALQGIPFGAWDYNPEENEKHIYAKPHRKLNKDNTTKIYPYHGGCFSTLSNITLGLERKNLTMIASYINKGKSSVTFGNILIPVIEQGYKTLLISNEQDALSFKILLSVYVASKYYNYFKLTRKRIKSGDLSEEDEKYLRLAQKFIKKFYYDTGLIQFCKIYDYSMEKVTRAIKRFSKRGGSVFCYDVLKSEDSSNAVSELLENSKTLFQLASKTGLAGIATMQLRMDLEDKQRMLGMGCVSFSKHVFEVFSTGIMFRNPFSDELDPESKFYLKPYKWVKDNDSNKLKKQEVPIEKDADYSIFFVVKNRADEVGQTLLVKKNLALNMWEEVGYCEVSTQNKY